MNKDKRRKRRRLQEVVRTKMDESRGEKEVVG
jgi:hypothetical protein